MQIQRKKMLIVDDSMNWIEHHMHAVRELFKDEYTIDTAASATVGFEKVTANLDAPYDVILVDMQMESNYLPLFAGEWLIKQIKFYNEYKNSKIFIISAVSNIKHIAQEYDVNYIPKYACTDTDAYRKIDS